MAKKHNKDLLDYMYDFEHLSRTAVSKKAYAKCKEKVVEAIRYKKAFAIIYVYDGYKDVNTFSYKKLSQIVKKLQGAERGEE